MPITMNDLYRQAFNTITMPRYVMTGHVPEPQPPEPEPMPDWERDLLETTATYGASRIPTRQYVRYDPLDYMEFDDEFDIDEEIVWNPRTTQTATYIFANTATNWVDIIGMEPPRPPEPAFDHTPETLDVSAGHVRVRVKGLNGDDWTGETTTATDGTLRFVTDDGEDMSFLEGDKIAILTTDTEEST